MTLRHDNPDLVPNGVHSLANGAGEKQPRGNECMGEDVRSVKQEPNVRDADNSDDEKKEIEGDDEQQQTSEKGPAENSTRNVSYNV